MCQTLLGTGVKKEKCIRHSLSERTGDTDRVRTAGPRSADAPATQLNPS